jgi:hypothetical protein
MSYALRALLDDFNKLSTQARRPPTFMEIAGYPHYENACSNILAYFLDPAEPHGLGTLVLDALADAAGISTWDKGAGGNVFVEREVLTGNGNRIDVLVETDAHAILIENKIYAAVENPFDDYADYLDRRTSEDRLKHKLLLTLYQTDAGSKWGFNNVTYVKFVDHIRSMLGRYVSGADTRYLTLLLDFLNTLENLPEGTRMNQEFLKLLSERKDDIENLLSELKGFTDELRKKVKDLGALIDLEKYDYVHQSFYRERMSLFDALIHYIVFEDFRVAIYTYVGPEGWHIDTWAYQGDRSKLRELLQDQEITFEEKRDQHFHHPARFDYDDSLDRIKPVLQDLIDRLATRGAEIAHPQAGDIMSNSEPPAP